ncbi:MAG: type II secretion system protein GspE, partial [Candidatus Hydrogenedentes bacterium]|nr:type II secretion system protein GspE [Candidatus Hydrogenedentota bacterium]
MPPRTRKRRLGDVLLEQGLITEKQLQEAVALQRGSNQNLAQYLLERGYLAEEDLVIALSEQLGIPHIRVANYHIPDEILREVPASLARQYLMLPVSVTGDVLTLAMADPLNIMALDDLQMLTSYEIEPVVAVKSELEEAIERHYGGRQSSDLFDEIVA